MRASWQDRKRKSREKSQKTTLLQAHLNHAMILPRRLGCSRRIAQLAFLEHDGIGIAQARSALRALAQHRVARLCIARAMPRCSAQVAFTDGIADTDVHLWRILLRTARRRIVNATAYQKQGQFSIFPCRLFVGGAHDREQLAIGEAAPQPFERSEAEHREPRLGPQQHQQPHNHNHAHQLDPVQLAE